MRLGTARPVTITPARLRLASSSVATTRLATTTTPTRPATLPREDVERDVEQERRTRPRALDPFKVVLHNDDHNSMDHVVRALTQSVPGIGLRKAFRIMLEAHKSGKAVVIVCPLEPAELYRDRLQTFGLTATIERA